MLDFHNRPVCSVCKRQQVDWYISRDRTVKYKDICMDCKHRAFQQVTDELEAARDARLRKVREAQS